MNIPFVSGQEIADAIQFEELTNSLREAFAQPRIVTPIRHHHDFANPEEGLDSTLLLMPAWQPGIDLGVKMVTVSPNNGKYGLPSIQGLYILMDGHKGVPQLILDARELTVRRTAATSALASSYLSRPESRCLLMIGTGALAPNLIAAHAAVRPIKRVIVWGRDSEKARAICDELDDKFEMEVASSIESAMSEADIISCATLSEVPLVHGKNLIQGQHLDLVGAYKKDMREADDEAIMRSSVFIDTDAGLRETGDLVIPLEKGVLKKEDIRADLFDLCGGKHAGRDYSDELTLFKSVGHAMEDLVAARLVYQKNCHNLKADRT